MPGALKAGNDRDSLVSKGEDVLFQEGCRRKRSLANSHAEVYGRDISLQKLQKLKFNFIHVSLVKIGLPNILWKRISMTSLTLSTFPQPALVEIKYQKRRQVKV